MPWEKTTKGAYERPMHGFEGLMGGGETSMVSWAVVKFDEPDQSVVAERLKQAWLRLSIENMCNTDCRSPTDGGQPTIVTYPLDTAEKLDQWAEESFKVDNDTEDALDYLPTHGHKGVYIAWLTKPGHLVMTCSHGLTDAYGMTQANNKLLDMYAENLTATPSFDTGKLRQPVSTLLNAETLKLNSYSELMEHEYAQREILPFMKGLENHATVYDRANDPARTNLEPGRYTQVYTAEETLRIRDKARSLGTKVGTLLWAAVNSAMYKFGNEGKNMIGLSPFDVRQRATNETGVDYTEMAFGVFTEVHPVSVPIKPTLEESVPAIHDFVQNIIPLTKESTKESAYYLDLTRAAWDLAANNLAGVFEHYHPSYSMAVSILGDVTGKYLKPRYDGVTVNAFDIGVRVVSAGSMQYFALTFDGCLRTALHYSASYYTEQEIDKFGQYIKNLLLE